MIYRNDTLIVWDGQSQYTETEQKVREEILEIRNKFFNDNTHKKIRLLYPKGMPNFEQGNGFEVLKSFPIPLNSSDGEWRWSSSKRSNPTKSNPSGFHDSHIYVKHSTLFGEKDIEFIWFLLNRSAVLNKYVFIEDLEADAKKEVEEMASDADIRYMIMGSKSPIAKDDKLIRGVADIFGVKDVDKMKINQVKKALYDALVEGETNGDKFTNFEKFEELTEGSTTRKAAFAARNAIKDNIVRYKDRAWWLMSGRHFEEKLMNIKSTDGGFREQVFIDEVVKNKNVRDRLFSAMGIVEEYSIEDLRELDRNVLRAKYKELTNETTPNKATKEDLVKLVCDELKINYSPLEE